MTKNLTEKQQKFMAVLFDEAGGDVVTAKKLDGAQTSDTGLIETTLSLKEQ